MHMPLDELRKATAAAARACLPELEQISARLFDAAHALAQHANQTINDHRAAGCETRALGMSVRTQAGLWGPRLVWVRVGRRRPPGYGAKVQHVRRRFTTELPMPDGISTHKNNFLSVDQPLREALFRIEEEARVLRKSVRTWRQLHNALCAMEGAPEAPAARHRTAH